MLRNLTCLVVALVCSMATPVAAQTQTSDSKQPLFVTPDKYQVPYRIPAITTTKKGDIIAVADRRYCGADIGFGKIDIVARTSRDNGRTWSPDTVIQRGSGVEGSYDCGYGDAAIVADRTSNRVLCMSVTGNVVYIQGTREKPNRIARWYSPNGGKSWTKAEDVTDAFYEMLPHSRTMFIGSGRLMQSRLVRKGRYYRVYCSVLTRTIMPDGISVGGNSCNGEIYLVDATEAATGRKVKLMLQSLPFDDNRARVGIWYKEIKCNGWYSTLAFAQDWTRGLQVTDLGSAYSTMTLQRDGRIGFFYEEEPQWYTMVYVPLTISQITNGQYR